MRARRLLPPPGDLTAVFRAIPHDRRWLRFLVVVNLAGSLYGFQWYATQLASTSVFLWPVVPDSPLSSLLFGIYLLSRLRGNAAPWLGPFAQLTTLKYGLWTVIVLGGFLLRTGQAHPEMLLLVATHAGMALEAFLFLHADPPRRGPLLTAFAWSATNDLVDYGLGTHPSVPDPQALPFVAAEALALSWVSLSVGFYARRRAT